MKLQFLVANLFADFSPVRSKLNTIRKFEPTLKASKEGSATTIEITASWILMCPRPLCGYIICFQNWSWTEYCLKEEPDRLVQPVKLRTGQSIGWFNHNRFLVS